MVRLQHPRCRRGPLDNRPLIAEILQLPPRESELLGYRDFADFVLDERMAHTGQRAHKISWKTCTPRLCHSSRKKTRAWRKAGRELGYQTIEPWDVAYIAEKQRLALYRI